MKNVVKRTLERVKKNVIYYLKSIMQRKGFESRDGEWTEGEASIQHPFSIHSASIGHPLRAGGKQVASSLLRSWKYAATLTILLTLSVGQMWGAELKEGQYIYINYSTSTWGSSSAKFKFNWYWNVGDYCCVNQEAGRISGVNYAYAQTQNAYTRAVQILRFNSDYSSQWNYTNTVAVSDNSNNCITLTASVSDNYSFSWTTYAPPMSTTTLSDNGTSIVSGSGTSGDPYLVYVSTPIKVSASGTKAVNDPDATINYNFKQSSTSKQNGTGTTYQFTASATANTSYTINVDGYTKVGSTSSTTIAATALYYKTIAAAEPTHDVTIYYKYGSTTIKDATTENAVGESTSRSITAPTITGYTFSNWTKGSGITITSGSTSTATISITSGASDNTLTANYTEDLSSPYTIKGGTNLTGNNWTTAYAMTKKSGHSTESVAYYTFNVSGVNTGSDANKDNYGFKILEGGTYYGLEANGQSYWWTSSTTANQTMASGDGGKNIQICSNVVGPYEVKLDYSNPSSLKVTVTFPTSYTLTYDIGTVKGTSGSITCATASGSQVISGSTVTLTGPAAKTGYSWKGWYTDAAGTTGKITDSNRAITVTMNADKTLYACYTENMTTVTLAASPTGKGTFTIGGAAATSTTAGVATKPQVTAVPVTGYRVNTSATVWAKNNAYITLNNVKANPVTVTGCGTASTSSTLTATFTPITYSVHYNANGGAGTMSNSSHTYDAAKSLTTNAFTRSGYTFAGWATSAGESVVYSDGQSVTNLSSTQGATVNLYAKWTAKQYTVNLSQTGAATTGTTSVTATYASAMPTAGVSMPTAAAGYGFMGYFADEDGEGTQYYTANGTSARTWNIDSNPTTLYAYFKKAQITNLTFSSAIVDLSGPVSVTATIAPTPVGTKHIEWRLLYSNGNEYETQPTFTPVGDNGAQFDAPNLAATYKLEATLRTGTTPGSGTILSTYTGSFQVAGEHTVTLQRKCGSEIIQASTSLTGIKPLQWSSDIAAPEVFGYTFDHWDAGDGVVIKDGDTENELKTSTANPIKIKASYDGPITAVYTQNNYIYFKDNLGWTDPNDANAHIYVNLYTADYWGYNDDWGKGSGNNNVTNRNLQMDRVPGTTNIFYYNYEDMTTSYRVSFTKESYTNSQYFWQGSPNVAHVVYPTRMADDPSDMDEQAYGFSAGTPMFVPLADQTPLMQNSNRAEYYNRGYWTKYTPGTGYTLEIYNAAGNGLIRSVPFTSADDLAPMKATVNLEGAGAGLPTYTEHDYKFQIKRDNDIYLGNAGLMTEANHGQATPWMFSNSNFSLCRIRTSAAGDYTFTLSYGKDSNDKYRLRVAVEYPVSVGDYRIYYTDEAKWSQSENHVKGTWNHCSSVIPKNTTSSAKADTVSLFISVDSSPLLKFQKVQSINASTGVVSWQDVSEGSITLPSSVTSGGKGVYNFIVSQTANGVSISLTKAEKYTGNYYIRSDCAGSSKWDAYQSDDHLMQYSDYAATNEGFTHYYAHWVERYTNIKFVIANDYSQCVSDTLIKDVDITFNNMDDDGRLYSEYPTVQDPVYDKYSANIRFMYNEKTNKISRAYVSGSSNEGKFIILHGASDGYKIYDENGNAFPATDKLAANTINLVDDQNFIYETIIKANPTARVKLTAEYDDVTQYFKGDGDASFDGVHGVEILGGTASTIAKEKMRIVYDFKTNRLVCAWLPSDEDITGTLDINADVMIIREHQEEAQQITFTNSGDKLDEVKTVYGVMRFNRWTLANKDKSTHQPLADPKSNYERQIYFISFPFDVKLSDIFGMGRYDDRWWIEYYDGADRAAKGFFQETKTFWKFMPMSTTATLKANQGYILNLDETMLHSDDESIWTNNINQVELFFPSASEVGDIQKKDATSTLNAYACSININSEGSKNPGDAGYVAAKDRRMRDSHWNCLGVPSYANYSGTLNDGSDNAITWSKWGVTNQDLPFLYTWNPTDNSLSPTPTSSYPFKTMNAYMVQYHGTLKWATASAPKSVAAKRNPAFKSSYMFRLELQAEGQKTEQTLVNLRDNDNVSAAFDFNYDLSNEGCAIYTTTSDLVPVAGNCLPLETEKETSVPVGVVAKVAGAYTFAMPDGTEGLSVTLVDNITGTHTNLALGDYTVELEAGTYDNRFMLVIDPRTMTTSVETVGAEGKDAPRKVFINGLMYIQHGNALYDTTGRKVE